MKIVTRKWLDVGEITMEDEHRNKKFLSSILKISYYLLVLFAVLYGYLLLKFWIQKELVFSLVATCSSKDTVDHPYFSTCFCGKRFYFPLKCTHQT